MKTTLLLSVLCAVMAVAASASCGTATCADDEYCDNSTACQCNSTLYTFIRGSHPSPNLTCTGAKFNIQVSKCWLEANGYNTSNIRLNSTNPKCVAGKEIVNGTSELTIHQSLIKYDCNTDAVVNSTHVTYTNQLYIFAETDPIRVTNDAVLNVSCSYPLYMNVALNVTLHPILGITEINGPTANATYTAVMMAYKNADFTTPLSDSDSLTVEDTIYISVLIPDLAANTFSLKVVNIYASPTESSPIQYFLLKNGCPASDVSADQLSVVNNGNGTESRFAMKVFKIASSANVYLYADLALCTTNCTVTCSARSISRDSPDIAGRVSIYLDAADTNYNLDTSSASGFSMPWTLSVLIFSWILMKLM
uniref:Uromodulin-like protein type 2 n=1 Tax=Rana pirica TaxID=79017 RepID=A0A0E4FLD4_9NEOB|nr:uromodulin-like protein type 2 [Rana pirica]